MNWLAFLADARETFGADLVDVICCLHHLEGKGVADEKRECRCPSCGYVHEGNHEAPKPGAAPEPPPVPAFVAAAPAEPEAPAPGSKCPLCEFTTLDGEEFNAHMREHQPPAPELEPEAAPAPAVEAAAPGSKCPLCGFTTADGEEFNEHMREHQAPELEPAAEPQADASGFTPAQKVFLRDLMAEAFNAGAASVTPKPEGSNVPTE